jgi:transcriptional regulator GlxA family with amidase domain
MQVAIVVYPGFNELDAFANLYMINRVTRVHRAARVEAFLVAPKQRLRSMYGVEVDVPRGLECALTADAVLFSSGGAREAVGDERFISTLQLEPGRQFIGSQCSGALILARLGLLTEMPACTDSFTRGDLEAAGVRVLDRPFHARGGIATAGGCLASTYLSAWTLQVLFGAEATEQMVRAVAPVGEEESLVARVMREIAGDDGYTSCPA